jgi:hypothetical protein
VVGTYRTSYDGRHLRVWRVDGKDVRCSWSVLQKLKNEMAGPDACLIEVYPPEDLVVNEAPIRHFFCVPFDELDRLGAVLQLGRYWNDRPVLRLHP